VSSSVQLYERGPRGDNPMMDALIKQTPGEAPYEIVAIASSAGGLTALRSILSRLPPDFPASVLIVQHLDPRHRSMMAHILGRETKLPVKEAQEGEQILPGNVYIGPPNRHFLLSTDRRVALVETELVHFVRPSADLLFESVAASCREHVIALVLTGTGSDGSMGVTAVKKMGGTVIAQDEASAEFFGMPGAAIATGNVDFILSLADIPGALIRLVSPDAHD
jgi:two-component system chemotaxis response regulator CheB